MTDLSSQQLTMAEAPLLTVSKCIACLLEWLKFSSISMIIRKIHRCLVMLVCAIVGAVSISRILKWNSEHKRSGWKQSRQDDDL